MSDLCKHGKAIWCDECDADQCMAILANESQMDTFGGFKCPMCHHSHDHAPDCPVPHCQRCGLVAKDCWCNYVSQPE